MNIMDSTRKNNRAAGAESVLGPLEHFFTVLFELGPSTHSWKFLYPQLFFSNTACVHTYPAISPFPSCCMSQQKQKKFTLGAWNVRTRLDRASTLRPERRTALVAKELRRYRIDIAALSETRLADEGTLMEEGSGYTFFWKGKPQAEDRIHGVGFAIRTALLKNTPALPVGINERLMKVRIPLSKIRYLTVVSAYAPTLTSPDETYQGAVL